MRRSFIDYANAHADASNQQLLLNLARLDNIHPPYFLQMGGITAQYSFGVAADYNITNTDAGSGIDDVVTNFFDINANASESPVFNFTPLSGQDFSQRILSPISSAIFFSEVQRGFEVDLLLRIMVNDITLIFPDTGERRRLLNNPARGENYADFLRFSGLLRILQDTGLLIDVDVNRDNQNFTLSGETERVAVQLLQQPTFELQVRGGISSTQFPIVSVNLRSFDTVLFSLANEYKAFDSFSEEFLTRIPENQRQPVLRIRDSGDLSEPTVAAVNYAGNAYRISDFAGSARNRTVFTILLFLFNQISLDPNEVPTQQLIQVQ